MSVIYIQERGAYLNKRGERMIVTKNRQDLLDIPIANIDSLAILGDVQITMQLLQYLMLHGVDIGFFSFNGNYLGHACAESSRNIFVRLSQYDYYQDMEKRVAMAGKIVRNKISNQIHLIEQFRWTGIDYDWKADIARLQEEQKKLCEHKIIGEIMGTEGFCSKVYFGAYGKMFRGKISFEGRNRRPPRDPVNVILSLGYTFLTREVSTALEAESFEMYLGFLHGLRYGRKSLALDMVEEFRQPVIDRLTLRLFNKGMLSEYDFEINGSEVHLNEEGFRTFVKEYERWMTDKEFADRKISFRSRIKSQAGLLKRTMQGLEEYVPYEWRKDVCDQL